jgi:uncharacterized protein (DUF2164 family)
MKRINGKYAEINEMKALLADTDYHVIKEAEGDYNVPQEILDARAFARAKINLLEEEIVVLEAQKIEESLHMEEVIEL